MDTENSTALKVSVLGVFLVCIFPHFSHLQSNSVFGPNAGKYVPEKTQIRTLKKCRGLARPLVFWCFQKVYKGNISTE